MKILLVGATGFIGTEILRQCISHTYVSHVYVLTRQDLPDASLAAHPKITQLPLHEDFEQYPASLTAQLSAAGVTACIWALGSRAAPASFKTLDEARRVGIAFPVSLAEVLSRELAPALRPWTGYPEKRNASSAEGGAMRRFPFRFVFVSGWGAELDQFRRLWVYSDSRKIKGAAEKGLNEVVAAAAEADGHKCFEVISLRPGRVLAAGDSVATLATEAVYSSVTVDRLAKKAIDCVLFGADGKIVVENGEILGDDWAMGNSLAR